MAKKKKSELASALEKARRSGKNLECILGVTDPNSVIEREIAESAKLTDLVRDLQFVGFIEQSA